MLRTVSSIRTLAVVALATSWSVAASAQEEPQTEPAPTEAGPEPEKSEAPPIGVESPAPWSANTPAVESHDLPEPSAAVRHDVVRVNLGFRFGYIPSRAFDTFASNDVLGQFSIDGTYPFLTRGKLVVGAGLGWDFGGRSDTLRGLDASLTTHRLYVPVEGRYYVLPSLAVFGKLSPGVIAALSAVKDPSAAQELSGTGWAFSTDASVGASILLGPRKQMEKRMPRFWITPELGYALSTKAPVDVNPGRDEEDVLGSDEDTDLRALALSGFFWRASVGLTF